MRVLFLSLVFLCTVYGWQYQRPLLEQRLTSFWGHVFARKASIAPALVSRAYLLEQEGEIRFPITPGAEKLKVISNARLLSSGKNSDKNQALEEVECGYAVDYSLVREEQVLRSGTYHFLSKLSLGPRQGTAQLRAFFDEHQYLPMDSRTLRFDLRGLPRANAPETITFRLHSMDAACAGAVLRIYAGTKTPEQQLSYLWERLNQGQREKYALGNVYPADFLTQEESTNALRMQYAPLAPDGVEGRDYQLQRLHIVQEEENDGPVAEQEADNLLQVDQQRHLTIPLPEQGVRLRLLFTALDSQESQNNKDKQSLNRANSIQVHWYGERSSKQGNLQQNQQTWTPPWQKGEALLEGFFAHGLLEILASHPAQVQVLDLEQNKPYTWDRLRSRMFLQGKEQPTIFHIQHLGEQAIPFRCTFRQLFFPEQQPALETTSQATQQVRYALLDKKGKELRAGNLALQFTPSAYDLLDEQGPTSSLSEPQKRYFLLSPEVEQVVFSSQEDLLIAGANRPPDIPEQIRVPDDYQRSTERSAKPWTWFPVRPKAPQIQKTEETASFLVTLQDRPPEVNEEILAGQYRWESYRPEDDWAGHYLLEPRAPGSPVRQVAADMLFRYLPLNRQVQIQLQGQFPGAKISPRLIFSKKTSGAETLQLSLDSGKPLDIPLWGKQGIIPLPQLATGRRSIRCTASSPVRLLLSNCVHQPSHLLRFANKLEGKGLQFSYEKKTGEEELLSMLYFPGHEAESIIHALLLNPRRKPGPLTQFSSEHRIYRIRPAQDFPLLVLHRKEHAVAQGQRLFFRLGADLPPGRYLLRVWEENKQSGYLQFYRVIPGKHAQRRITRE